MEQPKSKVLGYLINSCRLYWQKEMEQPFAGKPDADELRRAYRQQHLFDITSPQLTEAENQKQMQALVNKLFTIGYYGWAFKTPSRTYAAYSMDWKIDEMGECNGGTGKSFLFEQVLAKLIPTVKLNGRDRRLNDNPHRFDQVNRYTRMVLVDDLLRDFPFRDYYSPITGALTVNPKNLKSYTIPFEQSPKFAFTTNYVPREFDASSERRLLYNVSSDYYHTRDTEGNEYLETRTIRDDFDKDLFGATYTEDEWNADYNLMLQCVRFYMQQAPSGVKIQPPMDNILLRSSRQTMADKFFEWASQYFAPYSGRLDCLVERDEAINDFRTNYNMKDITSNMFYRKMKAFVKYCSYTEEFNPEELCARSKPGHILRRKNNADGSQSAPIEWMYIRTNPEKLKAIMEQNREDAEKLDILPTQGLIPFDDSAF